MKMQGKALLLKTISVQQKEVHTDLRIHGRSVTSAPRIFRKKLSLRLERLDFPLQCHDQRVQTLQVSELGWWHVQ